MLTAEQIEERKKGIGASDSLRIVNGDWYSLWAEKTSRQEHKAILSPWDAAVRHALEPLIMDQYEKDTGNRLTGRGEAVISDKYPILRCTLDGYDVDLRKPIDAKALNIWTKEPEKWCIEHYASQMQHQMLCMNAPHAALYVSFGMAKPFPIEFTHDDFWCGEYVELCQQFWSYIVSDTPPEKGKPMDMIPKPPLEEMRVVSMDGNNAFASAAKDWLDCRAAAKLFDTSVDDIKKMIEPDVRRIHGYGIEAVRGKRGISIKELKK